MAIELYRNPDGSVGGLDAGKVMVAPTQEEFEACCCKPCTDCGGMPGVNLQPNLVASVGGACDPNCLDFNGEYSHIYYSEPVDGSECCWLFEKGDQLVVISAFPRDAVGPFRFFALAFDSVRPDLRRFGGNVADAPLCDYGYGPGKEITGLVWCKKSTKALAGSFSLDGQVDCLGCTLEVTLGG